MVSKLDMLRHLLTRGLDKASIRRLYNFIAYYTAFQNLVNKLKFEDEVQKITKSRKAMGLEEAILQEVREQGIEQKTRIVVIRAYKKSFSPDDIAETAALTVEEVEKIIEEHKAENNTHDHHHIRPFRKISLLAAALLWLMVSSCNGQADPRSKTENGGPLAVPSVPFKDPLFFIDGQLCQHLREIYQDKAGDLWLGTNVYDLMRYNGDTLNYITEQEGFSGGRVTGIAEDSDGNLWLATGFGLNKYDGHSFTVFTEEDGLSNSEIWSMHIDSGGIIWIGHNEGLSRFDGTQFENFAIPKPEVKDPNTIYSANRITGIAGDQAGNLWLGTDGYGICRYDGQTFTSFTTADGLCDNTIYDLMVDRKGNLWIGTYWGGVSQYDGQTFTNYTQDGVIGGVEAGGFFEDTNGDIWFGVENNGVYRYDGKVFKHYTREDIRGASVLSIYKDREDRFWLGGWGGLFRYDKGIFTPVTKDGPWE